MNRYGIIKFESRNIHGAPGSAGIMLRFALLAASLLISLAVCIAIFN